MSHWLHQTGHALLDFIFPPRCCSCSAPGAWLCAPCIRAQHYMQAPLCERCGQELGDARSCSACRRQPPAPELNGLRAVAHHAGALRKAIHALKYERLSALAEPLGQLLGDYLTQHPLPCSVLIPVPLHPERQAERGYNQSALLAQVMGRQLNLPVNTRCLQRIRNTRPQVGLNEQERQRNLREAFDWRERVDNARVILIDDVCTTGSTLSECAQGLHAAGAQSVWGLTLAR